jgi:hypothetical protein
VTIVRVNGEPVRTIVSVGTQGPPGPSPAFGEAGEVVVADGSGGTLIRRVTFDMGEEEP